MNKYFVFLATLICFFNIGFSIDIQYELSMQNPNSHYFEVKMDISDIKQDEILIKMPVWAPGSYLVREFAKSVNLVKAKDGKGKDLNPKKVSKNTWAIPTKGIDKITVNYEVYAFEMSVRTSFVDDSHAYVNGTSLFMYVDGFKNQKGKLKIIPHKSFKNVSTILKHEGNNIYSFSDYDELVDSPIEIGNHEEFTFTAGKVKHRVAMYGEGNYNIEVLKKDMAKIVDAATDVFGENPNKEYLFIIHNLTVGSGGLEHKASTTLQVNRWTYDQYDYLGFISLVAHEYFHLWNVKRIRPKALGPFDYDNENYTDLLWVMEGFTSYYDELLLRRAGFYSEDDYIRRLVNIINYVENQPGNKVQPVAHSSYDAWIKAYRTNENSANTTVSYYSKGQILAAMLDLYTINKFNGKKSLDDFMQKLYKDFYKKNDVGFTEEEFQKALEEFLGEKMDWFFEHYVYDTKPIDYKKFFSGVGLTIYNSNVGYEPYLGVKTSFSSGKLIINNVYSGTAAEQYGLSVNDEIIGVNGYRVDKNEFEYILKEYKKGDEFDILISRDNILKSYKVKMGGRESVRYTYKTEFNDETKQLYDYWLRVTVK